VPEPWALSPQDNETSTVVVGDTAGHHPGLRDTNQKKWGPEPWVLSSRGTRDSARDISTAEKTTNPDLVLGGTKQRGPEPWTLSSHGTFYSARKTSATSSDLRQYLQGVQGGGSANADLGLEETKQKTLGPEPWALSSCNTCYSARETSTAEKTSDPDLRLGVRNQRGPEPWTLSSPDTCYSARETSTTSSDLRQYSHSVELGGAVNTHLGLQETQQKKWGPEPWALSPRDTCYSARETSTTSSELVNPDFEVGETKQKKWGPEPWAKSCDTCYSVRETSSLPTSYRNYLRSRGSLSMKNTSFQKHAVVPCSQANTSPANSMASVDSNTNTPSSARVPTQSKLSPLLHVMAMNSPAGQPFWQTRGPENNDRQCITGKARVPASMPNCHQQAQAQAVPVASPSQTPPLFNSLQLLPSIGLERCQSARFLEQMPAIPAFSEKTLSRSETLPNLWSVCDSSCSLAPASHQQVQAQAVPVAPPSQTSPLFNSLQLLPSIGLERCQSARFLEQMPAIPAFSEKSLTRSETLPNLWSVCDSPRSLALASDAQSKDVNLMAIAMPDAFSLSRSEIAAQLRLAAPCTYED